MLRRRSLPILSPSETASMQSYLAGRLAETMATGQDNYSLFSIHLKYGKVYDLLNDPRIVNIVSDILGPNVIGWGSHLFAKLAGDGKTVSWHQDAR